MRLLRWLGYVWAFPHTLVGFILMPFYGVADWCWRDGCLEVIVKKKMLGDPDAQTHGWIIFYRNARMGDDVGLRVHERTHVIQGMIGGPLFVITYGLFFLIAWAWQRRSWFDAYMANPYEKQAYARQYRYYRGEGDNLWGA